MGKQTPNIPRNFAAAGLRWQPRPRWNVGLQTRWVDRTFGDADNTLVQNSYIIADVHVDYQLTETLQAFVSASNLFNRRYIATNSGFEPQKLGPPVQAFLGMRWRLQ